jgi:fructose-bisphosphate aldolase, class I
LRQGRVDRGNRRAYREVLFTTPGVATEHLNAMNAMGEHPWQLSFSYGRALQGPVLEAWRGEAANTPAAQKFFYQRAKYNGAARYGKYTKDMETALA